MFLSQVYLQLYHVTPIYDRAALPLDGQLFEDNTHQPYISGTFWKSKVHQAWWLSKWSNRDRCLVLAKTFVVPIGACGFESQICSPFQLSASGDHGCSSWLFRWLGPWPPNGKSGLSVWLYTPVLQATVGVWGISLSTSLLFSFSLSPFSSSNK